MKAALAVLGFVALAGCNSLTEPSAIAITKDESAVDKPAPQGAAANRAPGAAAAQPAAPTPDKGGAAAPAKPRPIVPAAAPPMPAGGSCGG